MLTRQLRMSRTRKIRLATRKSELALVQARLAADALGAVGLDCEVVQVTSEGDRDARSLVEIGGTGVFTRALEAAILDGRADAAVHSAKDLPTRLPENLFIAAALPREDPRDVLVSRDGVLLADLPAGAIIGTSSARRAAAVLRLRPDLAVSPIRGNVPTRVRKVESGEYDAAVLAAAGLKRLGMEKAITEVFESDIMPGAAAQGAIVIEAMRGSEFESDISKVCDAATLECITAERALLRALGAGCRAALGALAVAEGGGYFLRAEVLSAGGAGCWRCEVRFEAGGAEAAGVEAARELLLRGAGEALGK